MRWYLVFVGTTTMPVQAETIKAARQAVIDDFGDRGITLAKNEIKARRAKRSDAGWLQDMGAGHIADEIAQRGA